MESQMHTHDVQNGQTGNAGEESGAKRREGLRAAALANAMRKRNQGVPSYTVPEAAALLSISQEYLYRLIQADGFPALVMRLSRAKGRYVVPAKAIEKLLADATDGAACVDVSAWTDGWRAVSAGGVA
jgi:excisionase family DNA binding protein